MDATLVLGLLLIALGAFASSSFSIPFVKIKNWNWENYWLVCSLSAFIVCPIIITIITVPQFAAIYKETEFSTIINIFFCGILYTIGSLSFGLMLRYLGVSLGYALGIGLTMSLGTLLPPLVDGRLFQMVGTSVFVNLISGVAISFVGILLSGLAGYRRSKESNQGDSAELNYPKGAVMALIVGLTGSIFSFGLEQGNVLRGVAVRHGANPLFCENLVLVPLLFGTFLVTFIWCLYLGWRLKSNKIFFKKDKYLFSNYFYASLAGVLWYIQFLLFGMGKSKMGEYTFIAWGVLMSLTIVFATFWGMYRKEWKGSSVTSKVMIWTSIILIMIAAVIMSV